MFYKPFSGYFSLIIGSVPAASIFWFTYEKIKFILQNKYSLNPLLSYSISVSIGKQQI